MAAGCPVDESIEDEGSKSMPKHYSISIEAGWPMIRGPYLSAEVQVATIRHMIAEGKRLSGKHAADVFFLDVDDNGPRMGKVEA